MDQAMLTKIATTCAVVVAVSCFLPWVSVSTPMGSGASHNVLNEGFTLGFLILIGGAVAAAILVMRMLGKGKAIPVPEGKQKLLALACLAVAALFAIINFFKDYPSVSTPMGTFGASRGIGLWFGVLASIGGTIALGMTMKSQLKELKDSVASAGDGGGDGD